MWLQAPNQSSVHNLNNVKCDARRHFRNTKDYLKAKIDELETNSRIKNIKDWYRGISDVKKGCEPRTNTVKAMKMVIWLQIPIVFWVSGGPISLSY